MGGGTRLFNTHTEIQTVDWLWSLPSHNEVSTITYLLLSG